MAIGAVLHLPTTIESQIVLGNFVRTQRFLRYRDNDYVARRVQCGLPLFEMSLEETVGEANSGHLVIRGECPFACAYLRKWIDAGEMQPIDSCT